MDRVTNWPHTRAGWARLKAAVADWRQARRESPALWTPRIWRLDLTPGYWLRRETRQAASDLLARHMLMPVLSRRYPIAPMTGEVVRFRRPVRFEGRGL